MPPCVWIAPAMGMYWTAWHALPEEQDGMTRRGLDLDKFGAAELKHMEAVEMETPRAVEKVGPRKLRAANPADLEGSEVLDSVEPKDLRPVDLDQI